jgi:hypothetical protein
MTKEEQEKADAKAEAKDLAAAKKLDLADLTPKADETVPGGRYIVNGVEVNADGEPLGKKK